MMKSGGATRQQGDKAVKLGDINIILCDSEN
jgi:hypothetical protein